MTPRPRLLVVAGPNGSGKTTVTERGLAHTWFSGCEYVNPDLIAHKELGDWNSPTAVAEAARIATARRQRCIDEGKSLAFETVFSAPDKVEFVREAQRRGYFCRLFFVGTASPTINAARVARRVLAGGHDVPIPKIIGRYHRSIANCAAIAVEVDRLYLYDNSIDDLAPRLFIRAADGVISRHYGDVPA
ncbi:MAG: zeta toxin family protein [Deltaproteobacteria bacterium]|nr:zeta toxin family protein [Deltaproteobacteria bacterium]